jgi:glycosyltransferase involved in cell wall biosynthesis
MASFGPGYGRLESMLFRAVEKMLARQWAAVCAVGQDLADRTVALGVPRERVHVVRSGVPLPEQLPTRADARRWVADEWGVPSGRPLVVYVGSLEARKNVVLLPLLLAELRTKLPVPPVLLVLGDGPQRDELTRHAQQHATAGDMILTGHVAAAQSVTTAMRAADLVVLLSRSEGLPQVLVQASAVGTPWVAFDVDGVRELLDLGVVGDAVPLGDVLAAADAAARRLGGPPATHEPVIDLSSWRSDAIRAAYREHVGRLLPGLALDSSDAR